MAMPQANHPAETAENLRTEDRPAGEGVVRVLTLDRPARRNALNTALVRELRTALELAGREETVRAVVLSGRGKSFCAGGDLTEFRDDPDARSAMLGRARLLVEVQTLLPRLSIPVVSAARGAALGAGASLVLGSDMAIGGRDLVLGYPELADGVVPSLVMVGVSRQLGRKLAFELITTGRRMDAAEALERGIVNRVVDDDNVLEHAIEVAELWAGLNPRALAESKRLFHRITDLPEEAALQTGLDVTAATWAPREERLHTNGDK